MLSGWMGRYVERVLWRWNPGEGDCGCASGMLLKKKKKKVLAGDLVQDLPKFSVSTCEWANSCAMEKCGGVLMR